MEPVADTPDTRNPLQVTFDYLVVTPNTSALRVLVSALEEPNARIKAAAVSALLRRGQKPGLRALVRAYHVLGPAGDLLAEKFDTLIPALRESVRDEWLQARNNTIDLICRYGGPRLAPLLSQALTDPAVGVRERTADAFVTWAREIATDWRASRDIPGARAELTGPRNALLGALWEAFRLFDTHRCSAVLEALIQLDPAQLAAALSQIRNTDDPRLAAVIDLIRTSEDPQVCSFTYALLEQAPPLWSEALRVIGERGDAAFMHALLDGVHALDREGVCRRLQRARQVAWLEPANADLTGLSGERMRALVRFMSATGVEPSAQAALMCQLLGRVREEGRLAIVEAAGALCEEAALPVVQAALLDQDQAVQTAATQLVLRSQRPDRDRLLVGQLASPFEPVRHLAMRELSRYSFQRYLNAFDQLDPITRQLAGRAVQRIDDRMVEHLADELHTLDPKRRFRALQVVQALHLEKELPAHLVTLMNDPDRVVRATVVRVLGVVRMLEAMQAIVAALGDPDQRVQANAIEVLGEVHSEKFVGLLEPFLRHPNSRVRANAARALIRLDYAPAREVLFSMLEDPSERMRLSAVWVLSHAAVAGSLPRLERLALEDPAPRVRTRARQAVERLRVRTETFR